MQHFAALIDRLTLTPSRNGKLKLMSDYFRERPDPERGWALAAITGELDIANVKANTVKTLTLDRVDEVLFRYSYDFVGDLAETVALVWPERPPADPEPPTLAEVIETLNSVSRAEAPRRVEDWLDVLDSSGRYAMLKLVTGAMRIGVSARLAKQALAQFGDVDIVEIEELWHGLEAPYEEVFAWLEGEAPKPVNAALAPFRPVMLATPAEDGATGDIDLNDYAAEWKWDGIRVQATSEGDVRRLYSRTGDDISGAFPDVVAAMNFQGSIDGELLVGRPRADDPTGGRHAIEVGSFSELQQRLNRKSVSEKVQRSHPAFIRAYDILAMGDENLRPQPFRERRERLEAFVPQLDPARFDLSELVDHGGWEHARALRNDPPHPIIEGLMFKRWDSAYVPGRPRGPWLKWKRDPFLVDAVMMYAQRGHGKRSSFYSDYTFGAWEDLDGKRTLVPIGKAYSGFTDAELRKLDKYVRDHTTDRFGPVRGVRADAESGLVLEIAFEGLQKSTRHRSGVAMRFPRVNRIRWDKPSGEADTIETMHAMLDLQERGEHMGAAVRTGPRPELERE